MATSAFSFEINWLYSQGTNITLFYDKSV
jgi:hypothetical protein